MASQSLARLRTRQEIDWGHEELPKNWNPFHYMYHYNAPIFRKTDKHSHLAGTHHHYIFYRDKMTDVDRDVECWYRTNAAPSDAELKHWVPR